MLVVIDRCEVLLEIRFTKKNGTAHTAICWSRHLVCSKSRNSQNQDPWDSSYSEYEPFQPISPASTNSRKCL